MLNPNETNRERLLRLIDGGPEVVKEVQEERKPAAEEKKAPMITPVTPVPSAKKEDGFDAARKLLARVHWDAANVGKLALGLIILIFALRAGFDFVRSFGKSEKTPVATVTKTPAAAEDEGTGLRLVGVDWGDPPVALLEDLKTGKTYFAHKDDKIKETRVKQIFKDKVVVVLHGKTLELR